MRSLATRPFTLPFCLVATAVILFAGIARADDFTLDPNVIKAALHTATEEEEGFIDRTIAMVKSGKLPLDMFTTTFIWARRKPHHQFQYFRQGLILRASEAGINFK
jgi:hypothetical protein